MAMTDPLGDMLTRIRNGQQAKKDFDPDSGVEAACPRPRRASARRLHPRLFGRRARRPARPAHRAQIFRRPAGDPPPGPRVEAGPAGLFGRAASCRASATGSARSSCRPRAVCCRTPRRATRMSAAKCWRRYSNVPYRQKAGADALGRQRQRRGPDPDRQRSEGHAVDAAARRPREVRDRRRRDPRDSAHRARSATAPPGACSAPTCRTSSPA